MPCASAPKAPCVDVWLSPQTIVVPGSVKPCSGPMIWTMPWRRSLLVEIFDAELPRVRGELSRPECGFRDRRCPASDPSSGHCDRRQRASFPARAPAAGKPQPFESLRARHLMHEMAIDIDQARAIGFRMNEMIVPDFIVECARLRHGAIPAAVAALAKIPFRVAVLTRKRRRGEVPSHSSSYARRFLCARLLRLI